MSRTSRQKRTGEADFYSTPPWCVHRLLDGVYLPRGRWLEPAVGNGAIVRAVDEYRQGALWTTTDIRQTKAAQDVCDFTIPEPLDYIGQWLMMRFGGEKP